MLGLMWGEGWNVWRASKKARSDKLEALLAVEVHPNVVVNRKHPVRGITPLMAAAKAKHTTDVAGCVRILIDYGADVNTVDNTKHRKTALHYAAYNNKATAIGVLLDAGANIFARNADGFTALDVAWMNGRREAARVLMKRIQLHRGWLDLSSKVVMPRWERRWCVVLDCGDSEHSSVALCVFDRPDQVRPERILQFGNDSTIVIPSWSPLEFQVDGVMVQQLQWSLGKGESSANQECYREFAFDADDRRAWVDALRVGCTFTTGGRRASRIKPASRKGSKEPRTSSPLSLRSAGRVQERPQH